MRAQHMFLSQAGILPLVRRVHAPASLIGLHLPYVFYAAFSVISTCHTFRHFVTSTRSPRKKHKVMQGVGVRQEW